MGLQSLERGRRVKKSAKKRPGKTFFKKPDSERCSYFFSYRHDGEEGDCRGRLCRRELVLRADLAMHSAVPEEAGPSCGLLSRSPHPDVPLSVQADLPDGSARHVSLSPEMSELLRGSRLPENVSANVY